MPQQDFTQIARTYYESFNAKDFQRTVSVVDENVQWLNRGTGELFSGIEGYRKYHNWMSQALPDARIMIKNIQNTETGVLVEFTEVGTNTGRFETPTGVIEPTGKHVELNFCEILNINNGKITEAHTYFDSGSMLRQLGVLK